ncbi:MAG: toxin ParE1/3/4 [Rickettsiales bacterium]|jgi:toxin ParE1/3/4
MSNQISLSCKAKEDLREIAIYTYLNWSKNLSESYLRKIDQFIGLLLDYPRLRKKQSNLFLGCPTLRAEEHIIFYLIDEPKIEIVRILHKNSNHQNHLGF